MARRQTRNPEFKKKVVRPHAENLARKFWLVIQPQLRALGVAKMSRQEADKLYTDRLGHYADVFEEALVLMAKMKAAPDFYRVVWPECGSRFDRGTMIDPRERPNPKVVSWCIFPHVVYNDRAGGPDEYYGRAKVWTKDAADS